MILLSEKVFHIEVTLSAKAGQALRSMSRHTRVRWAPHES